MYIKGVQGSGPNRPLPPTQSFGPSVCQDLFHRSRPQRIRAFVVRGLIPRSNAGLETGT